MILVSGRLRGLVFASAAVVSCGGSGAPIQIARNSNFATFSSVTGSVSTRWPDGRVVDSSVAGPDKDGGVGAGLCEISLYGDVSGRVGDPETFFGQPSRIIVECESDGGELWHLIGATDNLALTGAGEQLSLSARTGGPLDGCADTTMSVDVSVSVTDAIGTVDPSTIDVGPDFLRRVRIAGRVGQTACGLAEMNLDIVAEIRADAFNFTEGPFSGSE
jgi:hypothetical protein